MEVKHCRAQHEVLVTYIRYTLQYWGPWDELPLSYWIDHTANRANHPSRIQATPELKLVLTRARALSEECCRSLPPLRAALLHSERSVAFTDILKEIQWCVSVVSHGRLCRNVNTSSAKLKDFPWDAKVGDQEQLMLKEAEQEDWRDLILEFEGWDRDHECSAEQCGNKHGRSDRRFCVATQLLKKWSGQDSGSNDSEHLSMLWSFDEEVVNHGRLLGSGSFGAVTQSTWLGIEYAQKIFSSARLTSLHAETEALAKLNHPHIVKVYACSENSFLLDLMSSDLHKFMRARMRGGARDQPFSLPAAMDLMLQIADAVSYLHSQGMAHRDLKSSNVLVEPVKMSGPDLDDGYVFAKVADFGLAKVKHELTRYSHCTHNVGTRRWMAPEIFGANKDDEHLEHAYPMKADVYSFGVICCEILSGEEPYSDVPLSSLYSKLTGPFPLRPRLPSSCPTALVSLICSCWDADPRERPAFADVCRVLRYLKGVETLREWRDSCWNPIDEIWPFGRLPALVKPQSQGTWADEKGRLYLGPPVDIRGVRFHYADSTMVNLSGFSVACSEEGQLVEKFVGRVGGISTDWIMFDYPSEYLVQVEVSSGVMTLNSLSFITTRQKYGPYGKAGALDILFSTPPGRVVGFTWDTKFISVTSFLLRWTLHVHVLQDIVRCIRHFLLDEDPNV